MSKGVEQGCLVERRNTEREIHNLEKSTEEKDIRQKKVSAYYSP